MKQTSLTRRLFAGAVGLTVGALGAVALGAPASAQSDQDAVTTWALPVKSLAVTGAPECDADTGDWTVLWTVTNTSTNTSGSWFSIDAEITEVEVIGDAEGPIEGDLALGTVLAEGESASGTQVFSEANETAQLTVELTWTWGPPRNPTKHSTSKLADYTVELGKCKEDVPPPPPPDDPVPPNIIVVVTCDLLAFIVDNSVGDAEAAVSFIPNETVTHGHASGFSYTIDESDEVVVTIDDDASVETVGEADSENPVNLAFAAGDEAHTHAFEAFAGLEITVELSLDGESVEFEDGENIVSWDEEVADLDCDEGAGGELPVTGASTGLIALGALVLLALGGGLFLVARRRRVTFTA